MSYATVRAITSPELTALRSQGQWSRLYMAIFKPSAVYTARLATLPSSTDRVTQVDYNTGSGTLANVLVDMTMYVGSSPGIYDLGVARIRKAPTASVFYIGEESEVAWQSNCYLTIVNDFDLWAKHIVTVSDTEFYMDTDVVYTDQNSVFNPIPVMGSHRVLKLTGANVSTTFDFSNSYCLGSSISGYSVACSTATITNGTTATPTLQFTATGWHVVVLTVTAANGKTSFGVRYVYIYNSSNMPATVFQLSECHGDFSSGGWSFSVTMQGNINLTDAPEHSLCILFAEDYYSGTNASYGQLAGCENVICVGRIAEEEVDINPEQSEISVTVQGMQYWLSKVYAFPTGVILSTTAPTDWIHMQSPTVDKVLFRLLYWGCTATKIMDIYLTGDTRLATELISPASNLWGQIQEIAFATIQAYSGVDRFGRMFIEVEPQVVPVASRTWPTVMTITKKDWHESIRMQRIVVSETGMVNSSGVNISSDGSGSAIFSLAPGHVFRRYGQPDVVDRMLLSTQLQSNQIASLLLNWKNNPYPVTEMRLSANNRMIDCFPRQRLAWSVAGNETPRGFSISGNFIPRRVEFRWDSDAGYVEVGISIEMEVSENLYINGDIPGSGDYDPSDPPSVPPMPPLPPFVPIVPIDINPTVNERVIVHSRQYGLLYTTNFKSGGASVVWKTMNGGLSAAQYQGISRLEVTPNGKIFIYVDVAGKSINDNVGEGIWYAPKLGDPFVPLIDYTYMLNAYPSGTFNPPNGVRFIAGMGINPLQPEEVAWVGGGNNFNDFVNDINFWVGTSASFTKKVATPEVNGFMGSLSYGNGRWILTGEQWSYIGYWNGFLWRIKSDGSYVYPGYDIGSGAALVQLVARASTTSTFYLYNFFSGALKQSTDNGDNLTTVHPSDIVGNRPSSVACDYAGRNIMADYNSLGHRGKSSDYGATWAGLPALPSASFYVFAFAGGTGSNRFVAASTNIYLTEDFGVTWEDKTGNIYVDFPLARDIDIIKVID